MTLLLEPDLSSYTDEAYEADLTQLPPQRYEKAMTYRFLSDRKRCVRAYMLLWDGLSREYGAENAPLFDFLSHGKPVLRGCPDLHFSLSHSGNAVLCALDRHPVGADIEMIRHRSLEHLLSVFSDRERASIEQAASPALCFTRLWTRKESYLKLTGEGLTGTKALREIPTEDTDMVHFETVIREAGDFLYSVCQWTADMP